MNAIPQPLYLWQRALVPTVEDGGNQGQSGRVQRREYIFSMGARDFQPVASFYTGYTNPAPEILCRPLEFTKMTIFLQSKLDQVCPVRILVWALTIQINFFMVFLSYSKKMLV
jgi:hypothetical protein